MRSIIPDLLCLVGCLLIICGGWTVYPPLGLVISGALLIGLGIWRFRQSAEKAPDKTRPREPSRQILV
jgi:hypothetical protein